MGYFCANFSLRGLSVLDLSPMYATDRQTSDAHNRLMPAPYGGGGTHVPGAPASGTADRIRVTNNIPFSPIRQHLLSGKCPKDKRKDTRTAPCTTVVLLEANYG